MKTNQFKYPTNSTLYVDWNTRVNSDLGSIENKKLVLEFMNDLCEIKMSKRLHWYSPGTIKHLAERWLHNKYDNYGYVSRDLCTAFAIALGQPVDLKENADQNKIGLWMSQTKFNNLHWNISNQRATDLHFAASVSAERYHIEKYKKDKLQYGY